MHFTLKSAIRINFMTHLFPDLQLKYIVSINLVKLAKAGSAYGTAKRVCISVHFNHPL